MNYIDILYNYTRMSRKTLIENDKTKILDPITTVIKLALLSYKSYNSKISINSHTIYINELRAL